MPLYDYDCAACGRRFEVIHGVHADPPSACPLCGSGPVRKAIAAPAVHFKGSGWAKKERRASTPSGAASGSGGEASDPGEAAGGAATSKDGSPDGATAAPSSPKSKPAASTSTSPSSKSAPPADD